MDEFSQAMTHRSIRDEGVNGRGPERSRQCERVRPREGRELPVYPPDR